MPPCSSRRAQPESPELRTPGPSRPSDPSGSRSPLCGRPRRTSSPTPRRRTSSRSHPRLVAHWCRAESHNGNPLHSLQVVSCRGRVNASGAEPEGLGHQLFGQLDRHQPQHEKRESFAALTERRSLQTLTWPAGVRIQRASSRPPPASVLWSEARPSSQSIDLTNSSILVLDKYFVSRSAALNAVLHFRSVAYRLLPQPCRHRCCTATPLHLPPGSARLRHGLGYLAVDLADHPQGHLRVGARGFQAERLGGCEYARVVLRLSDIRWYTFLRAAPERHVASTEDDSSAGALPPFVFVHPACSLSLKKMRSFAPSWATKLWISRLRPEGGARRASRVGSRCRSAWPYVDSIPCQRIPSQVRIGKCSSVSPRSDAALSQPCLVAPLLLPTPQPRVALWPSKWVCTRWVPAGPAATPSASRVLPRGLLRDSRTSCSVAALVNRLGPPFDGLHRVLRLALDHQAVSVPGFRHVVVPVDEHRRTLLLVIPTTSMLCRSSFWSPQMPSACRTSPSCRASTASSPAGGVVPRTSARESVLGRRRGSSLLLLRFDSKRNAARGSVGAKIESRLGFLELLDHQPRSDVDVRGGCRSERLRSGTLCPRTHSTLRTCRTLRPPFSTRALSSGSPVISSQRPHSDVLAALLSAA